MNTTDGCKDAVYLTQDITKQIITLTTGVLALSATFVKIFITSSPENFIILIFAWSLLTFSIIAGLFTLSSMVNNLKNNKYEPFSIYTTIPAITQWICFILGFILFWIFVALNLDP